MIQTYNSLLSPITRKRSNILKTSFKIFFNEIHCFDISVNIEIHVLSLFYDMFLKGKMRTFSANLGHHSISPQLRFERICQNRLNAPWTNIYYISQSALNCYVKLVILYLQKIGHLIRFWGIFIFLPKVVFLPWENKQKIK